MEVSADTPFFMKPRGYIPGYARNGLRYAHPLESEMAEILDREGVPYEYEVSFKVKNGAGTRRVDFVLQKEVKTKRYDKPVKYVEIKNWNKNSRSAKKQHDDLVAAGIETVIFNREDVNFFKKNGFSKKGDKAVSL